jgi:DNA mismatch repair protein MutL
VPPAGASDDRSWAIREPKHHHTGQWPLTSEQSATLADTGAGRPPRSTNIPHEYPTFDELGIGDGLESSGNTLHFADTYIIYNRGRTVYLIDQHNLHERILYENFRKRSSDSKGTSQALLFPVQVQLTPSLAGLVIEHQDELASLGFEIEEFSNDAGGGQSFVLRAVPQELGTGDPARALADCLERAAMSDSISEPGGFRRAFEVNLACKSAIKAGHPLTQDEMDFLISHIDNVTYHTCPHGRPSVIRLDEEWFRKSFKRS